MPLAPQHAAPGRAAAPGCPVPRQATAPASAACPVGGSTAGPCGLVPAAELVVRRILRVPTRKMATNAEAQRLFGPSMLLSALRCLLTYVVFPVVTPLIGTATSVAPAIGLPIAVVALIFDIMGIRRFWLANHRWRWLVTFVYLGVMALVSVLLVGDVVQLA